MNLSFLLFLLSLLPACSSASLPLRTSSRWIVNGDGNRIKLACVSWSSHMEVMFLEGLSKQPLDLLSDRVISMGFDCVRLTWPLFMFTNESLSSQTVEQSFRNQGLIESIAGIKVNNPDLLHLSVVHAFKAVVSNMGKSKLMVILDNHISVPEWCCNAYDENGFFGDKYLDPDVWIMGLTKVATMFNGSSHVVAMSLRNELRGPRQNLTLWYRYMQRGAEAVHSANPNVLVVVSGLSYSTDLSFLVNSSFQLSFSDQLVFEHHWYSFSNGNSWENENPNDVCGEVVNSFMKRGGFLLDKGFPLMLSEFGVDQRGINEGDNRYLNCLIGLAAELDLDWAYWPYQGSYYLRQGIMGYDESYGLLNWNWCGIRNPKFLKRVSALQSPFRGPGISDKTPYQMIFHPMTGLCVLIKSPLKLLALGSCEDSEQWNYTPETNLMVKDTGSCIQASHSGEPVKLSLFCSDPNSKWERISKSKNHLSSKLDNGQTVCLDVDETKFLVTNSCKCLTANETCDPASQWFKIIKSTRNPGCSLNPKGHIGY